MNLHNPHVSGWINSLIDSGRVKVWVVGPSCRTVSVCRHRADDGPVPLRARTGPGRFGLEGLKEWQQEAATGDTVLWLKNLAWMKRAQKRNPEVKLMVEQPQDPAEWKNSEPGMTMQVSWCGRKHRKWYDSCG